MKIVLAFDSFKDCLSAVEVCRTAADALHKECPETEVSILPLSDGGEGMLNCIQYYKSLHKKTLNTHDALMRPLCAQYALTDDMQTAYVEMASTCGLELIEPPLRNPMQTTTYALGEMLADIIKQGVKEIVLGIGGSATCDGGLGMIECLCKQFQCNKTELHLHMPRISVVCDVSNPLLGEMGAAKVFGPQKGATKIQVEQLEKRLTDFANDTEALGLATSSDKNLSGAGAAGGLGYGLVCYLGAALSSGIDIMLGISNFTNEIIDTNWVITGEGKSDEQTLMGKVPSGVLKQSKKGNACVWLLSGQVDKRSKELYQKFNLVSSINEGDNRPIQQLIQPEVAKENIRKSIHNWYNQYIKI